MGLCGNVLNTIRLLCESVIHVSEFSKKKRLQGDLNTIMILQRVNTGLLCSLGKKKRNGLNVN